MSYTVLDSLPFPGFALEAETTKRLGMLAAQLTCVSSEMAPYWNYLRDIGWTSITDDGSSPLGIMDEAQRQLARCEIEALVTQRVFDLSRADVEDILETFPAVKRRDARLYGEDRTMRLILEAYDRLTEEDRVVPTS